MAKKRFSEMFETSQERQYAGLFTEALDKIDERFSDLDEETQARFKDAAREIATMRNDLDQVQANYRRRFQTLADHYSRGGGYIGPFEDREQAKAFGMFVSAVAQGPQAVSALESNRELATIGPQSGKQGGFLMPEHMLSGIVDNAESHGVFERNTRVWPVTSTHVTRVARGATASCFYPDYGTYVEESELTVNRIRTELTRYAALAFMDRWMLNDPNLAIPLGDYVASEFGNALARATDKNALTGDGSKLNAGVIGLFELDRGDQDVVADAGDTTFQKIIDASVKYLTKAAGYLPNEADDENCKWYMHRMIFWGFLGVRDANDRPIADILTKGDKPTRMLCGYPVEVTSVAPSPCPIETDKTLLVLANLMRGMEMYRHAGAAELRTSEHIRFVEGEVAMLLDVPQGIAHLDGDMSVRVRTAPE